MTGRRQGCGISRFWGVFVGGFLASHWGAPHDVALSESLAASILNAMTTRPPIATTPLYQRDSSSAFLITYLLLGMAFGVVLTKSEVFFLISIV